MISSWKEFLQQEKQKDYYKTLVSLVEEDRRQYKVFPKNEDIFNAFKYCPLDKVKAVIIGQDCYHTEGQAQGLCFSCLREPLQPSLKNIFKELKSDLGIENTTGDLTPWTKQGVLLLNSILTVREGQPGSHKEFGWMTFTDNTISLLNQQDKPIVYLLWGKFAQEKANLVDNPKQLKLETSHPSFYSANRGFFGCQHFSKVNHYLKNNELDTIDWKI